MERMFEWQYRPGEEFVFRFRPPEISIFPEAARGHARTARKESLLALRSLIDSAIEGLERKSEKPKRKTKSEVE